MKSSLRTTVILLICSSLSFRQEKSLAWKQYACEQQLNRFAASQEEVNMFLGGAEEFICRTREHCHD